MRILIVDDSLEICKMLQTVFTEECFAVDVSYDGKEGSYLARTNDYDLIVMDNKMPVMTGPESVKEIRKSGRTVPILFLSVESDTVTKVQALNDGADDYLTKPFAVSELLARTYALLRRPKVLTEDILTLDDLCMNLSKHKVTRGERANITLTRKEFMLLEFFLRNKGLLLSRAQIMEHVWNIDADPFSNTIEAHIFSLRKKIGYKNSKQLIHTVPGCGYKLGA